MLSGLLDKGTWASGNQCDEYFEGRPGFHVTVKRVLAIDLRLDHE
jgi:hypothetical protein